MISEAQPWTKPCMCHSQGCALISAHSLNIHSPQFSPGDPWTTQGQRAGSWAGTAGDLAQIEKDSPSPCSSPQNPEWSSLLLPVAISSSSSCSTAAGFKCSCMTTSASNGAGATAQITQLTKQPGNIKIPKGTFH